MKEYATRPFRKQKIRKWKKMQQNSNTVTTFRKQNVGIWKKIKMQENWRKCSKTYINISKTKYRKMGENATKPLRKQNV